MSSKQKYPFSHQTPYYILEWQEKNVRIKHIK